MRCWNSAFNAQGSRLNLALVQAGAVKIYVAAVEALRKNERQDETQFTTKFEGFLSFSTIHHSYIPCLSHKALETRRTQGLHRKTTTKKKTTDIIARVAQETIIIIIFFFFFVSSILFLKETSLRTFLSQSTTTLLLDLNCFFSFQHLAAGVHFCRVGALEEERGMARNTRRSCHAFLFF